MTDEEKTQKAKLYLDKAQQKIEEAMGIIGNQVASSTYDDLRDIYFKIEALLHTPSLV